MSVKSKRAIQKVPALRFHKGTGHYRVTLNGRDIWLGSDPKAAQARYQAEIARWLSHGRQPAPPSPRLITVMELVDKYTAHLVGYLPDNTHRQTLLTWCGRFADFAGGMPAAEYGPLALQQYRAALCDGTLSRRTVNRMAQSVTAIFAWGASMELIPGSIPEALRCVKGLRRGHAPGTTEPEPVRPVEWATVAATLPHLPRPVRELVLVLWHCGARVGELVAVKAVDIDRSGPVWTYAPKHHKTAMQGKTRVICFGPEAQKVLREAMLRHRDGYLFPPADAMKEWSEGCRVHRRPNQLPNLRETNRTLGEHYTPASVCRAVAEGVRKANKAREAELGRPLVDGETVPHWHVHQMRHSYATRARQHFGLEAARAALGHSDAGITLVYAEADKTLAANVAARLG